MRYQRRGKGQDAKGKKPNLFGKSWVTPVLLLPPCLLVLACLAMVSCASKQVYMPVAERAALEKQRTQESEAGSNTASMEADRAGREGRGITEEDISRGAEGRSDGPMKNSLIRDIYFDFDSYTLKGDDLPRLRDLAAWLKGNKRSLVKIEGHCDERGSIEYNMALGQKRAEAVREYLLTLGVDRDRIKTISYGKETPVDVGHTEEAWGKNRRAHMTIE